MPAFVFPGQGAQRPGMGRPWLDHPSWEVVEEASRAAQRDIGRLLTEADDAELTETRNAQLATFTLSLLVLDAVERLGIAPTRVAGHSVGEYAALAASGILGFDDSVRVVAERGEAMQAAADAHAGVMAVIAGCDAETAEIACRLAEGDVWLANYNSPEETVVAGVAEAVDRAGKIALTMGARRAMRVRAGGAFHTPHMATARDRLRKALDASAFHDTDTPVAANVDGRLHTSGADWRTLLSAQLCSPVRWHQSLIRLAGVADDESEAEELFVEIGPGGSLSVMISHTLPNVATVTVSQPNDLDGLVEAMSANSALQVYAAGHQGELLYVSERVVISPAAGVFAPPEPVRPAGSAVAVGASLGSVGSTEVLSPFAGTLQGWLAQPGERVQAGQPIVWLHSS